jgi:hypothetical protein
MMGMLRPPKPDEVAVSVSTMPAVGRNFSCALVAVQFLIGPILKLFVFQLRSQHKALTKYGRQRRLIVLSK